MVVGKWSVRCEFIESDTYEVECAETHLSSGYVLIRRYLKQTNVS